MGSPLIDSEGSRVAGAGIQQAPPLTQFQTEQLQRPSYALRPKISSDFAPAVDVMAQVDARPTAAAATDGAAADADGENKKDFSVHENELFLSSFCADGSGGGIGGFRDRATTRTA